MPWLENPNYVPARERLVTYFTSPRYRFRRLAPVVFLCGGLGSKPRDTLRDYLRKYHSHIRCFYAERVWEQIASLGARDALQMEAELALLADMVVLIVESPGTFTELGAFSISDPLRDKLLPIVDDQYRGQPSFISTGPLRWIDAESKFTPTIFTSLKKILQAIDEVEERIKRIQKPASVKISDLADSPKHLLFFLCDLVAVIYPATREMVEYYIGRIAPSILSSNINIPTLLGLAVALDLLNAKISPEHGTKFFGPAEANAVEKPFHHSRTLDLPSQRADHVSAMLRIDSAKRALEYFGATP